MRINCKKHGVLLMSVPWAEDQSRYTALFEGLVIDWLQEASISAIAEQFNLSWSAIDRIMKRAVNRGLSRRQLQMPEHIGIDETSFQKHHEYVTVVTDGIDPKVLYVADDRKTESLDGFFGSLSSEEKKKINTVSMDMWDPYIAAVKKHLPEPEEKIAFDKFHIAKHLGDAANNVRKQEHRLLMQKGCEDLKGTKFKWLTNPLNMSRKDKLKFSSLRDSNLKTARAWPIKETAMHLWTYSNPGWIYKSLFSWLSWVMHSGVKPMKKAAKMFKEHLGGLHFGTKQ